MASLESVLKFERPSIPQSRLERVPFQKNLTQAGAELGQAQFIYPLACCLVKLELSFVFPIFTTCLGVGWVGAGLRLNSAPSWV